jgi:hypothetical protein
VKSIKNHMSGNATNHDLASQNVSASLLTRNNFRLIRDPGVITQHWATSRSSLFASSRLAASMTRNASQSVQSTADGGQLGTKFDETEPRFEMRS